MVMFCVTTVQCQSQDIDIGAIHRAHSDLPVSDVLVCVWGGGSVQFCLYDLLCVDSCNHDHK